MFATHFCWGYYFTQNKRNRLTVHSQSQFRVPCKDCYRELQNILDIRTAYGMFHDYFLYVFDGNRRDKIKITFHLPCSPFRMECHIIKLSRIAQIKWNVVVESKSQTSHLPNAIHTCIFELQRFNHSTHKLPEFIQLYFIAIRWTVQRSLYVQTAQVMRMACTFIWKKKPTTYELVFEVLHLTFRNARKNLL